MNKTAELVNKLTLGITPTIMVFTGALATEEYEYVKLLK